MSAAFALSSDLKTGTISTSNALPANPTSYESILIYVVEGDTGTVSVRRISQDVVGVIRATMSSAEVTGTLPQGATFAQFLFGVVEQEFLANIATRYSTSVATGNTAAQAQIAAANASLQAAIQNVVAECVLVS